ncbi:MAG: hypothetical protein RR787_02005 [Hydrogenoanaerobacterium sp.]
MKSKTLWVTRTGVLLALVLVAQFVGKLIPAGAVILGPVNTSQIITGSLVNMMLVIAAGIVGVGSGITIGVLSSLLATLLGIGPIFPQITPLIAAGNAILVLIIYFVFKAANGLHGGAQIGVKIGGVLVAAIVKCGFLWFTVPKMLTLIPGVKPQQAKMLTIMFSWPQAVTAVIGGLLALAVLPAIKKALKSDAKN